MKSNWHTFNQNTLTYDNWFEKHPTLFQSELLALQQAISPQKKGIEIGVGTGRFAQALNIKIGVEPAEKMAKLAEERGIKVIKAVAENLLIENDAYGFVLMVTTLCFLTDIPIALAEAHRILQPQGEIILAIIDKNSELGRKYEKAKANNIFYKDAHFHSTEEISELLRQANFSEIQYWQTLFGNKHVIEQPKEGFGEGSFIVIKAIKLNKYSASTNDILPAS